MRRRFRRMPRYLACLLASVATARPARAAITVFSNPADLAFLPLQTRVQSPTTTLGARDTPSEPGSRTVLYIFQLPQSDTGVTQVKSARFSFTLLDATSRNPVLGTPSNYGIDLYGLPTRTTTDVLDSDNYHDSHDPATLLAKGHASDVLITADLLPRQQAFPLGEVATDYDAGTSMVNYLNAQYGASGSGAGKYIFLRLNTDQSAPAENTGGYVAMGEATTGRPYLTLTFVPEPSLALLSTALGLAALRRRPRRQD